MPRIDGLRRLVAAILSPFCVWMAGRRADQSHRWIDRGFALQAWANPTEPQTRS